MKPVHMLIFATVLGCGGFVFTILGMKYDPMIGDPGVRGFYKGVLAAYVVVLTVIGVLWVYRASKK